MLVLAFCFSSMVTALSAAPAYVGGNAKGCTATSCAVSLTNTKGGDLMVLGLFVLNSTSVSSVVDTQGNQYILIGSQTWSPNGFVEKLYYAKNIKGGADTATVTLSGSTHLDVRLRILRSRYCVAFGHQCHTTYGHLRDRHERGLGHG